MEILNNKDGFILGMEFHGILCQIERGETFTNKIFHTKNIDVPRALSFWGYSFKIEQICEIWSIIVFGEKNINLLGGARHSNSI